MNDQEKKPFIFQTGIKVFEDCTYDADQGCIIHKNEVIQFHVQDFDRVANKGGYLKDDGGNLVKIK